MGQKVNPIGFRIGVYLDHSSRWFARQNKYAEFLADDLAVRDYIKKNLVSAEVGRVEVERQGDLMRVVIFSARPGVVIGKKGQEIDNIRKQLTALLRKNGTHLNVEVSVQEIKRPELNAAVLAQSIATQLEKRVGFKRAAKKAAADALRAGARGVKVRVKGRLGGAEIAREEWVREGSVPLHTLRADVDYALAQALTTYGIIGVKVWIYRGDYMIAPKS
ncbi:MAG: 30S ribosomal protein S3 [candidate division TM6 bacterium GW2011_GWF2_43_17]|nr:MAG: 30S ribosomal protein S3 [candidate division TM6 bacterium GW2011_GWF2_43_17]HAU30138.1 30S ribosomal protein S3 [Candidatus Dependentiae bacterium]